MRSHNSAIPAGLPGAVLLAASLAASFAAPPAWAGEVNVYSSRQPFLMKPLLEAFTEATGIEVNMAYMKNGMLERLRAEGANSPADAILTTDIGNLDNHAKAGLLQPIESRVLEANIPAQYRHPDGLWFGLTMRARVIFAHKDRVRPGEVTSYEDLADPKMKGRVCSRSGKHAYNISLLASIVAAEGEAAAEAWASGVKANLARRPQGNDRSQVKAIKEGECDVALGNTYYMGKMATNEKKPEQKKWAEAVRVVFLNQGGRGNHINISGAAVTRNAKNQAHAVKLIEFLSGDFAQKIYASQNFEYPAKVGVAIDPLVKSWGDFKADTVSLEKIATLRATASRLVDKVRFNEGPGS